jgi:ferredoxin
MKIVVDEEKCIGAGQCVAVAPGLFDQRDEDGVAVLLQETPLAGPVEHARQAAAVCPALAITIAD